MIDIEGLLKSKELKPKEKTERLAEVIMSGECTIRDVTEFAEGAKDSAKATCMEAFEYVTQQNPEISSIELFQFAQRHINEKTPRLKWESAKVIGNIAHLYLEEIETVIDGLFKNTKDAGTVVRWSAAYALTKISALPQYSSEDFRQRLLEVCEAEEKNSIKKIYLKALR